MQNYLLQKTFGLLADLLWPRSCLCCGRDDRLDTGEICEVCWGSLLSSSGVEKPKKVAKLWVAFRYDERMRKIIHYYKFQHRTSLARPLAERMVKRFKDAGFNPQEGILIPVPDHPARRRERGYNPAGMLGEYAANLLNIPFEPAQAVRIKTGPHQSKLPDNVRKTKLIGSFNVAVCENPDLTLYLFDDVIHTGTTISRLAVAAKKVGWKRIEAICLCS
ncbi:MAG: hypothetical protein P9L92_04265 [Candidatus Electryonea clarkiae]|nr:hypothetical protein [Candidatus Electryonea clarkiae]MDP8286076.1 hypothetical protein [Candidatus Electryonea clarkiae]